ncbi:DUF1109 domain-containing protein [Thiorhodococcus minor]|uniref:DUF1109 domain-containing protein n=1 Tax=Thiorhodococcus minor TaxID=57489 RepID=A0A6M0JTM6_9GAMM|nr:DUF1109 domain-containing protein [Thiorhodococcus minor]NEV60838.1 DUF1109 domain-containing protein [Thiorhodococcus minor]
MKTDDLVILLANDVEPVERHAVGRRYVIAIGLGAAAAAALLVGLLGVRPDLAEAARLPMFWVKLAFVASLAGASLAVTLRLGRPGVRLHWAPTALALPVLAMWGLGGVELAEASSVERAALVFGTSWKSCPGLIATLSIPVFIAALWAMRGLAPTHLPLAGAASGLLAGAVGALVYCLHCSELGAPFLGIWYLIGMLIPAGVGGLLGTRLLRW